MAACVCAELHPSVHPLLQSLTRSVFTFPPHHTQPTTNQPTTRQAGSKVVCVEDGLPTWVCELMVVKPTVEEAIAFIKQIEESLDIPITPLPGKH